MSDTSQGEGWWEASDGKWYPPEQHPDVQQPTQPVDESGPPTEATPPPTGAIPPPTTAMPPVPPGPPTQAMPPPVGPPGGPPGAPPDGPPPGSTGGSNKKWIIPAAIAAVIVAIAAFLLLRGGDDNKDNVAASDSTDQSSDNTDATSSSSKSSSSKSSSSSSSSSSAEFVDPVGVEDRLLVASDIGSEFTDEAFTSSTDTTDPCGDPNARAVVPPTKDVGSKATEASRNLEFQEEVAFHKNAADNRKAFDVALDNLATCTEGPVDSTGAPSFTISDVKDVSADVGVGKAVEFTATQGDTTQIGVGVRLDNCIAAFTFQFPTSAGESAQPDEIGIVKDGVDKRLG